MNTYTKKQIARLNMAKQIAREKYAWPGGYPLLAVTNDGALLCADCVKKNFREIVWDILNNCNSGWHVVAITHEAVSPDCTDDDYKSYCDHCGAEFGELG